MKALLLLLSFALLLSGCRRESWQEVTFPAPPALRPDEIVSALTQLDSQTPPQVSVRDGSVHIRYNSLRIAPRNFSYHLEQLAAERQTP